MAFWLWCTYELILRLINVLVRSRKLTYSSFAISDWMINYQGGFVRRGIVGEALYQLYLVHPYSLRMAVFIIMSATFLGLLYLLYRLFRQNGWSYILLPSCVLIVQEFTHHPFWIRKDYILLLGAFLVFMFYRKWMNDRARAASYIAMQIVVMLLMLIHEATMFFTVPILFCDFFGRLHCARKQGIFIAAVKSLLYFLPMIAVWIVICLYKGDGNISAVIWKSWQPMMMEYPIAGTTGKVGESIAWLGKGLADAVPFHLKNNFCGGLFEKHGLPIALYCYVAVYYVVTRMQTIDLKLSKLKPIDNVCLSNILLLQFVFLLPMFTVLSCDRERTIPYWIVSSLFFYHFFGNSSLTFPKLLTRISTKVQTWIDSKPWLNNPWVYFAIIVTIPL